MTSECQLGRDKAIIGTLLLEVEKRTEARLEKLEKKLGSEMHVVKKKLIEKFVERNAAHEHAANFAEFESQKSTAKTKKGMANCLNQL